ncbi:membrane protein [Clostridium novyi A str. 4570]|uniref:Membrane protein n=1 Tax=Clostridium novyi A str. 4570 TaxID=1444290 RepID=A0AA88ZTV6_CLONO|nr:membrane protein [Clostridium novyi]KGN03524.1 membrane protein [Clostridium novyi A str. 4570]
MFKLLKLELKRSLINTSFLICIILGIMCCFIQSSEWMQHTDSYCYVELWTRGQEYFSIFFPLLVSIPYAHTLSVERKNHFLKYVYTRADKNKYLIAKGIANGITGGLVIFMSSLILFLVLKYIFLAPSQVSNHEILISKDPFSYIIKSNPNIYILIFCLWGFLNGFIWATFSYAISLIANNIFIVLAIPFLYHIINSFLFQLLGFSLISSTEAFAPYVLHSFAFIRIFIPCIIVISISAIILYYYTLIKENCYD